MAIQYRKNKQDDTWQAFGPVAEMKIGEVEVTRKDGRTHHETIISLSRSFAGDDGAEYCFGKIAPRKPAGEEVASVAADTISSATSSATSKPTAAAIKDAIIVLDELKAHLTELLGEAQPAPTAEHRAPPKHKPIQDGDVPW